VGSFQGKEGLNSYQVAEIEHPAFKSGIIGFDQETNSRQGERDTAEVYPESEFTHKF
jgi:hypothetical protein